MRNCGSHIGQAQFSDEVYGVDFGENWISVDPKVDYDKTLAAIHRTVEGYPGLYRDVQTYLRERIKEVLTGHQRVDRRAHLRPRPRRARGEGGRGREGDRRRARRDRRPRGPPDDLPHIEVELDLAAARRYGLKPGDVRRQTLHAARQRGGRRPLLRRPGLRRARVEHPLGARQPHRRPSGSRSTRRTAAGSASSRSPTCASRRRRTPSSASSSRAASTSARTWRAATSRRWWTTSRSALETVDFPLGYSAEVLGESTELNAAQDRLLLFGAGAAVVILLLLHAAFRSLRLARADLPAAADGAGRRRAGRLARRRRAVARLARRAS